MGFKIYPQPFENGLYYLFFVHDVRLTASPTKLDGGCSRNRSPLFAAGGELHLNPKRTLEEIHNLNAVIGSTKIVDYDLIRGLISPFAGQVRVDFATDPGNRHPGVLGRSGSRAKMQKRSQLA